MRSKAPSAPANDTESPPVAFESLADFFTDLFGFVDLPSTVEAGPAEVRTAARDEQKSFHAAVAAREMQSLGR